MRKEPFLERVSSPEHPDGTAPEDEGTVVQPVSEGTPSENSLSQSSLSQGSLSQGSYPGGPPSVGFRPLPRAGETVQVGDVLKERFVIEQVLGAGGMGKVFLALDLRKQEASDRNPYVAVKVLKESLREHPSSIIALQREARKAQELSHPNIIKVYDFDRDGDRFFITMEYLTGKSLDRIIRAEGFTPMPPAEAGRIVNAVGEALAFAHSNGFVHWDLKPGNIFITESGRVKVIDFGLARAIKQPTQGDEDATAFDVGSLGAMTPAYASPEMIETQTPDPRGDVYSLACITYELLAGHHPFGRMPATHARDTGMKPVRPKGLSGKSQWKALQAALEFDAARRTPSVEAFLRELKLGRGGAAMPWRRVAVGAGLAGTALAAAVAGVLLWPGGAEAPAPQAPVAKVEPPRAEPPRAEPPKPQLVALPKPPAPPSPIRKPVVLDVPKPPPKADPPKVAQRPAEPPGTDDVRALMGRWCGGAMNLTLAPADWTLSLPSGSSTSLRIARYEMADGVLSVELAGSDGRRSFWEFGEFSAGNSAMVQLRARNDADPDWREYNRVFRRC